MLHSKAALYSFASTEWNSLDARADYDEITDILQETLLSFRLLFGQSKSSRKFFRSLLKSDPTLTDDGDNLLYSICTKKDFNYQYVPQDRFIYFAQRDFPVLGERVELLGKELRGAKSRTWKDLIRDRRDTAQFWTFWLFAIFGVVSIVLSLIQIILAAVQVSQH